MAKQDQTGNAQSPKTPEPNALNPKRFKPYPEPLVGDDRNES